MKVEITYKSPPKNKIIISNPNINKLDFWNNEAESFDMVAPADTTSLLDRLFALNESGMAIPSVRIGKYNIFVDNNRAYVVKVDK